MEDRATSFGEEPPKLREEPAKVFEVLIGLLIFALFLVAYILLGTGNIPLFGEIPRWLGGSATSLFKASAKAIARACCAPSTLGSP